MKKKHINTEILTLKTKDSNVLKAKFYDSKKDKCVLLLHQFSKNKESWQDVINILLSSHSILSMDLRGHGESAGNYKDFDEIDFKKMNQDVQSAIECLEAKGIKKNNISLIGSSIGANLAQNYASGNLYDKLILLSPGKNYKGIDLIIKNAKSLIIVSQDDKYSYETVKELKNECEDCKTIYLKNKGHGMNILDDEIISSMHLFLTE